MSIPFILLTALIALLISACISLLIVQQLNRRRIQALTAQIEEFLSRDGQALDFSVREDSLATLQNAAAELQNRLLLARERQRQEGVRVEALAADISHQLKTPLASLRLFTEMDSGAHMEAQLSQIERMERLIYSLLRLEKLCADGYAFTFEEAEQADIAQEAWLGLAALFPACRLNVIGTARVRCDRRWMGEVYVNLMKNACEHMPAGGAISLRLELTDTTLYCTVEDEGGGAPEEELQHLFERFYRTKAQTDERSGCGLGLAIVREIIRHHHGDARAENGERGLRICFFLPIYNLNRN